MNETQKNKTEGEMGYDQTATLRGKNGVWYLASARHDETNGEIIDKADKGVRAYRIESKRRTRRPGFSWADNACVR